MHSLCLMLRIKICDCFDFHYQFLVHHKVSFIFSNKNIFVHDWELYLALKGDFLRVSSFSRAP